MLSSLPLGRIWLASASPRRRQLLEGLGLQFEIAAADIDEEAFPPEMPLDQVPVFLARAKAQAMKHKLQAKNDLLIASDTMVLLDGVSYSKPTDRADGIRILTALQGKAHRVVTGVCLLGTEREYAFADEALVHFAPMSLPEMEYYLDTFKPYDKAGAYAIQEWIGLAKIVKMDGAYTTIMGLPTHRIYDAITNWYAGI